MITLNTTGPRNLDKLLETGLSAASPHDIHQTAEPTVFKMFQHLKGMPQMASLFLQEFLNE